MKYKPFVLSCALALLSTVSWAGTITVNSGGGTAYNAAALAGFATTGAMMSGMEVTACLLDGSCSTGIWATTGATSGAAATSDWSLSLTGDSFSATWALSNLTDIELVSLSINARPGRTVFDIINGPDASPGSANGWPVSYVPSSNAFPNATAQYSDPLSIAGTFYGDMYLRLALDFGDGFLGNVGLRMDTDNVSVGSVIEEVPEPGTYALMGVGLLALAGLRARRKRA